MAKSKLVQANGKIAEKVVSGYKKIEDTVVGGYKKVEEAVVGGYQKMEDKFVDNYLTKEGESVEDAKTRIAAERAESEAYSEALREHTAAPAEKPASVELGGIAGENLKQTVDIAASAREKAGLE